MNTQTRSLIETNRTKPNRLRAGWLVVINHHEARVFRSTLHGTAPEQIRPRQTDDAIRHTHRFDGFSRGQEKPADHSFFGPLVHALRDAEQILIFGNGTGMANEMERFTTWLHTHHPELARRIVGTLIVDEHHLTDAQLLAHARALFEPLPAIK